MSQQTPEATAVQVEGLNKSFKLPHERHSSLRSLAVNLFRTGGYQQQRVLKNISFQIGSGEFFGVIGRNGSGKSTLLKLLAGIYTPDSGQVTVRGNLTPFIELGVGFSPELTGRDNIFLNGAILGLTRKEIESAYHDIVKFAELGRFMDLKLKNYSSGMQVRLAFSVAIKAHSDILLIDEVLAVGDVSFQNKCFEYFRSLKDKQHKTVVLVSHDMGVIKEFCDRGIVLHKGKVIAAGRPKAIMSKYLELNTPPRRIKAGKAQKTDVYEAEAKILKIGGYNQAGQEVKFFKAGQPIKLRVEFIAKQKLVSAKVGVAIVDAEGNVMFSGHSRGKLAGEFVPGRRYQVGFTIANVYTDGDYRVSAAVSGPDETAYARLDYGYNFKTTGWEDSHSLVHPDYTVSLGK